MLVFYDEAGAAQGTEGFSHLLLRIFLAGFIYIVYGRNFRYLVRFAQTHKEEEVDESNT